MRKFFAILSAIVLALVITGLTLYFQGKNLSDLFGGEEQSQLPPELPINEENVELDDLPNLSYSEHLKNGNKLLEQGMYSSAVSQYVKASNLEPQRVEPYLGLLQSHFELRNYNKALANAEKVLELKPGDLDTQFNLILIKVKLSQFEEAKQLLDQFPESTSTNPEALYYKGILNALFSNHDQAKSNLNQALNGASGDLTEKINHVLDSYQDFEVNQAAEELFLDQLLARSFNENQEYEMAIELLKEGLKSRPELRDGWILLGFAYLNLEQYQFALTALDKAYSLDSTWPTTQYFLGVVHKELGNTNDAITYFSSALSNNFEPEVVIQNYLAELYFDSMDYEKAAIAYEEVLKINQQDVEAFVRPVWIQIEYLEDPEKALNIAQSALTLFPESAMSYNLMGWSYIALEDYKNAEINLKKALKIDPELAAAHQNLGLLYQEMGDTDQALEYYQKAYQFDVGGSIGNLAATRYNQLLQDTLTPSSNEN